MARFEGLREELQSLGDKISELEMDAEEHRLVLAALAPLPPTRKCYRRIGGILTEGNVSTTVPVLEANVHGVFLLYLYSLIYLCSWTRLLQG